MRKLFFQMMLSADGFMEGPQGELDWHVIDEDFSNYVQTMLGSIDTILMGRVTYETLSPYWPTSSLPEAPLMNGLPKIVFSQTLQMVLWSNTQIARGDLNDTVRELKQLPGKDLALFGSARLATSMMELGLIDEVRLLVCPVFLGGGRPLFTGLTRPIGLTLSRSETFRSGTLYLSYTPA